jgi:alkylation response protein AidB-like acyl-CoA dehydrogenase
MEKQYFHADMRLFLDHRVDWQRYLSLRRGTEVDVAAELETYRSVLSTAAEVCQDIEENARDHWEDAARLENGEVVVPPHIASGYARLKSAGLVCLPLGAEYGGFGLPMLVNIYFLEMLARADPSLMTIVGLQSGVAADIEKYAGEEIKRRYLPRFGAGELQGAMDLTEPQAGSDLGGIATRVTEDGGRYYLDGQKIFITNGGADVHLVLARDAAAFDQSRGTTNGLSLMLCPRVLDDGSRNGLRVSRVEHKKGIHGSPTCVVELEHAEAFLLGERGEGFRAMLDLMNNARLGVAAQAIGIAEAAFLQARQYATDRVQFGAPIIRQPLVKSMLTNMAILIQSARALLYRTATLVDTAEAIRAHLERTDGAGTQARVDLERELEHVVHEIRFFTPLCKFYATEISVDATRKGIQIHGGLGYMAESYAGHFHEDAIITTIYEGTSEIQASFALKEMSKGALLATLEDVRGELGGCRKECGELVAKVCAGVDRATAALPALMSDPQYALLNAKRLCEIVIDLVVSAELLLQAGCSDARYAEEKLTLATTYINRRMLMVEMNAARIAGGDASRIKRYDRILGLEP